MLTRETTSIVPSFPGLNPWPVVLVIAALTFIAWAIVGQAIGLPLAGVGGNAWITALVAAIAVLVVACPCALGLATPTAIMVGTGKGAEQGSEHPLASAIVEGAKTRGLSLDAYPEEVTALAGRGLQATIEGRAILIGTRTLLQEHAIATADMEKRLVDLEAQGKTAMLVAIDGAFAGVLAVADTIKPGSREAIAQLHAQGLQVWMITGDNRRTALAIAEQAGIPPEHVAAEILPEEKSKQVKQLQEQGLVVAFAGDGINDAPALVQADAGIAMGTGTDVAIEASDITLVRGDLKSIASALALSRATLRTIKQNLFWAFAYNVILIPAAILSPLIPFLREQAPIFAAAAMALSSVTVVSNSLRLRRFGRSQRVFANTKVG